jgi:carboxypeptidase C (cathepsin A)
MKGMKAAFFGLVLLVGTPATNTQSNQAAPSQPSRLSMARPPRVAITGHVVHVNGEAIAYTATVADDIIKDNKGEPGAAVVTIAYTRNGVGDLVDRPVMFVFNGGPGASSSPLHMSGLGPVLRADPKDRTSMQLVENPTTPLDATDLVFIDPVSTGFSRALPGVDSTQWYNGKGDALEVATVIIDWLKLQHRERSPLFLCGESYGTTRAGLIVKYAPELKFNGVLLVSGGSGSSGPNAGHINSVGTMAAGAWYHNKVDRHGLTVQQFYAAAMEFARGEYADALAQGTSLPAPERRRVSQKLSTYIGLPVDLIESKDLKIDGNTYMFNLLKDRGLRTGGLDTRATSELKPNAAGGIDDPSLGVVAPVSGGAVPTAASVGPVVSPAVGRYISEDLKFPSTDPYYGVNFTANSQWVFSPTEGDRDGSTAAIMARAMKADLKLKLFAVSGIYDLGSSDGEGFRENGVPEDRLTLDSFPGPHEVYDGTDNRTTFDNDVRNFIRSAK